MIRVQVIIPLSILPLLEKWLKKKNGEIDLTLINKGLKGHGSHGARLRYPKSAKQLILDRLKKKPEGARYGEMANYFFKKYGMPAGSLSPALYDLANQEKIISVGNGVWKLK